MNKNVNIISLWTYVIQHLKDKEIVGTFDEKELQKTNQSLELKKY